MTTPAAPAVITSAPTFSKGGALALVGIGFALFLALLYLIGAGEDFAGDTGRGGQAHAASNGLNGYAGLVQLVEAQGYDAERSRSPKGLETRGLLVLTPTTFGGAEKLTEILKQRTFRGPTLVIMPKWWANPPPDTLPPAVRDKFKRGWVVLGGALPAPWAEDLPAPFAFKHRSTLGKGSPDAAVEIGGAPEAPSASSPPPPKPKPGRWSGYGLGGTLPAAPTFHAEVKGLHTKVVTDPEGRVLAFAVNPGTVEADEAEADGPPLMVEYASPPQPVVFLVEPDLANNYGLADPVRAAAAIALINRLAKENDIEQVTFDMTLNGFGASENLLTLAFRPPFLAATLCLLVALLIVGWRAFLRFGPAAVAAGPDIAFGKRQLITNGAGLILRARRFALLARPYAALSARRLAERLGLSRPDPEAIDAALARRLPDEEPYTNRAARLEAASKPADILAAAKALDDLNHKLS
jgi:hypothetical protein